LILFVRLVWSTFHQHCVSCVLTAPTGTAHSLKRITRIVRSGICSSASTAVGTSISRFGSTQHTMPRPYTSRNSAWGCGCNRHHDSCNARRVFVHPHNLEQYISPHPSVTFSPCHPSSYGWSYIAIVENQPGGGGSLALILGTARFFISIGVTLLFRIMSSSRMFGDRVTSKSCKYLASQTFTASYPILQYILWGASFYGFLYSAASSRNRTFS
jgi:hypothetical protein